MTVNGAEAAYRSAVAMGVEVCFANPGTTEMELVAAIDAVPGLRGILCLFEGVATGAADGYARISGRPALTLLHLGPGFANGIANLHNARRAFSPVVNIVGDHASWHLDADAPLTSDIDSLAHPVSVSVQRVLEADWMDEAIGTAVANATSAPGGPATVIVPQDAAWGEVHHPLTEPPAPSAQTISPDEAIAALKTADAKVGLLVGGSIRRPALEAAARIAAATGAKVWLDTFPAVLESGAGIPRFDQVPYFPEQAIDALADLDVVVVAGTRAPVAFFGYRSIGRSSLLPDGCQVVELCGPGWPVDDALIAVADALGADTVEVEDRPAPTVPVDGPIDLMTMGQTVAALQPADAIVVNEAATSGLGWAIAAPGAAPHVSCSLTGGAIGQGLPVAVGAAVAAPDRKVIALQADGSGMYTLQALWTMAREQLDVIVVVCANRLYRILQMELHRTGHDDAGPTARSLTDLHNPDLDWVALGRGMGVDGVQVDTVAGLAAAFEEALSRPGPYLIEAVIV